MRRTRAILVLLLILLTVTACAARPAEPTRKPSGEEASGEQAEANHQVGEPVRPVLARRNVYRGGPGNEGLVSGINQVEVPAGAEEVIVGSGEVMVTWEFVQAPADLAARIRTSGYRHDQTNSGHNLPMPFLQAHFPAGAPARSEVWLEGVEGSRLVLVRRPEPTFQIGYRTPGSELTMAGADEIILPDGPFTLEFHFDQPMEAASLDRVLHASGLTGDGGLQSSWVSDSRAVLEFAAHPGKASFQTGPFRAATGLLAVPRPVVVRAAHEMAYLERVNLVTGAAERVMDLPSEIQSAALSPDGRYLAITALQPGRPGDWWPEYVTVADLGARKLVKPTVPHPTRTWLPDNRLIALGLGDWGQEPGWAAWEPKSGQVATRKEGQFHQPALSPDGMRVASLERDPQQPGEPYEQVYPYRLVLTELDSGQRTVVEQRFINSWYYGKDGVDLSQWVTWSADGQMVVALDTTERGWSGESQLVAFDLRSMERRVLREHLPIGIYSRRLHASPDGKYLLTMPTSGEPVVIPLDGGPLITLAGEPCLTLFWEATGSRLLHADGDWGTVSVRTMATGEERSLGRGLAAGWNGEWVYIIRWPGADQRYVYQGL